VRVLTLSRAPTIMVGGGFRMDRIAARHRSGLFVKVASAIPGPIAVVLSANADAGAWVQKAGSR